MIKKSGLSLIVLGIVSILFFALSDKFGIGKNGDVIGAAQFLGIEFGVFLILLGIGMIGINVTEKGNIQKTISSAFERINSLPPLFWVTVTFLSLYLLFFISPMFFSKISIQYFRNYISNAWAPHIGFDIEMTVNHINDWLTQGISPYSDAIVPYTPLTLALFTPFIILGYPGYFKFLALISIFFYILAVFLIPLLVGQKKDYGLLLLFGIIGLFSYGFQFELERGQFNIISFALCLLALYIFHYQYKFRYFAYLLFSLAVQLKIYPAIFAILLIKNWRDWKNNIRRMIGLGLFNFFLLFVLGYQLFIDFLKQITHRQIYFQSSRLEDISISGFTLFLSESNISIFSKYADFIGFLILVLIVVIILAVVIHLYRNDINGLNPYLLLFCTLAALMVPTASIDYKLPILIAPMIILLISIPTIVHPLKKALLNVILIVLSTAYWSTLYPLTVKPLFLARNSPALLTILFSTAILYILMNGKFENITAERDESIKNQRH